MGQRFEDEREQRRLSRPWFWHEDNQVRRQTNRGARQREIDPGFVYLFRHASGGTLAASRRAKRARVATREGSVRRCSRWIPTRRAQWATVVGWPGRGQRMPHCCLLSRQRVSLPRHVDRGTRRPTVVLTEIAIHPSLAIEVGLEFSQLVTDGVPVGDALLAVRRSLLGRTNPCGLLYCLYGDRRLRMVGADAVPS